MPPGIVVRRILVIALTIHALAAIVAAALSTRSAADFDRYYQIGTTRGEVSVDRQVEHPVGTLLVFKALAQLPGGRTAFGVSIVALDAIADAIIVGALVWGWGVLAAAVFAVTLIPVIDLAFDRMDMWSTAAATLAVAAWRRDRGLPLGIGLAIGGSLKLWPLVLTPLLISPRREGLDGPAPRASRTALLAFAVTATALAAATLWLEGSISLLHVLTFRGASGWQVESTVGSLIHLVDSSTLRHENGSWRIGAISGAVSVAMFLAAAPICAWSAWHGARTMLVGTGWLAGVSMLLLLSALLSPQFLIWLSPAAAIAWTEGDRRSAGLAALAVVLTMAFWLSYTSVLNGSLAALLLVVVRNVVLALLAFSALARLRRAPTPASERSKTSRV